MRSNDPSVISLGNEDVPRVTRGRCFKPALLQASNPAETQVFTFLVCEWEVKPTVEARRRVPQLAAGLIPGSLCVYIQAS